MVFEKMDDRIKEIAKQIQFKELAFAKFKFIYDNDKLNLGVIKGAKTFYNKSGHCLRYLRNKKSQNKKMPDS